MCHRFADFAHTPRERDSMGLSEDHCVSVIKVDPTAHAESGWELNCCACLNMQTSICKGCGTVSVE